MHIRRRDASKAGCGCILLKLQQMQPFGIANVEASLDARLVQHHKCFADLGYSICLTGSERTPPEGEVPETCAGNRENT